MHLCTIYTCSYEGVTLDWKRLQHNTVPSYGPIKIAREDIVKYHILLQSLLKLPHIASSRSRSRSILNQLGSIIPK